ncbi:unnamed protein product, partial [Urochloa humidicola]
KIEADQAAAKPLVRGIASAGAAADTTAVLLAPPRRRCDQHRLPDPGPCRSLNRRRPMGDCVVEDGHGNPHPKEEEGEPPVAAVELDERAGESREEAGGQRKKAGGIRREPSFSRWCRDPAAAAAAPSNGLAAAATSDGEDSEEFELPLLPSAPGGGGSSSLPMDIEAGAAARSEGLPISPWLIAKVIGLIASWYTLSTCLTLYNKEMLGKHKWKFPAPFLMNTVHFTMQAVASKAIVWFQQRGLEGGAS